MRATITASPSPPPFADMELELPTDAADRISTIALDTLVVSLEQSSTYYLHACALDNVGYETCSDPYEFIVDSTPPDCATIEDQILGQDAPEYSSYRYGAAAG